MELLLALLSLISAATGAFGSSRADAAPQQAAVGVVVAEAAVQAIEVAQAPLAVPAPSVEHVHRAAEGKDFALALPVPLETDSLIE
jgi:hypothetical protein